LDKEWDEDDDIDIDDLPFHDPNKRKEPMDTTKLDANDHVKNFSQSNKGKQLGLYVTTKAGLTQQELALTFDLWQTHMINCCQFELTFMPLEGTLVRPNLS